MKIKILWKTPTELGKEGKKIYKRVGKELIKSGSLDSLDRESFIAMCENYDRMQEANAEIKKYGLTIPDGKSSEGRKKNPAFTIYKVSYDNYVRLLKHFGLTPLSRGKKVEPKQTEAKNGKAKFF